MKKICLLFIIVLQFLNAFGQGSIKGTVSDFTTKELLVGSTIKIKNTNIGTVADANGKFQIGKLTNGSYTIEITMIGYLKLEIANLEVENNDVELDVKLKEENATLSEFKVTSFKEKSTELAVINEIKSLKSVSVGIGSSQIQKSQDKDAAAVVKRLSGVSIQDDKFIILRGLNERYNTVLLNQAAVPSSEIDTKAFSFDLIPAGAIDRIVINKSNTAENPGEFGGGIIKVYTKTTTNQNAFNVNFGTSFRQFSTFQTANVSSNRFWDYLGLGAKDRALPDNFPTKAQINNNFQNNSIANNFQNLQPFYTIKSQALMPDIKLGVNFNRLKKFGNGFQISGINSLNYNYSEQFIPNISLNRFLFNSNAGTVQSEKEIAYNDEMTNQTVRLGLLSNWSFIFNPNHKIEFTNLINQLASKETVSRTGQNNNNVSLFNQSIIYEQKFMYSSQIGGTHKFEKNQNLNWVLGLGLTNRQEPDSKRFTSSRAINSEDAFEINLQQSSSPTIQQSARFFSKMNEKMYNARVDFVKKEWIKSLVFKTGFWTDYKFRTFDARWFGLVNPNKINSKNLQQQPALFYENSNLQSLGLYYNEGTGFEDKYKANSTTVAGYVQGEYDFSNQLNFILGLRNEYNVQQLATRKRGSGSSVSVYRPLNVVLPSGTFNYAVSKKYNIKLAYSKTTNRPEFRELAPFPYYDFNYDVSKIGNANLKTAIINNFDLGIQKIANDQFVSFNLFYKAFINPIEAKILNAGSGISFGVDNSKSAKSYGMELDIKQTLSFIGLEKTSLNTNVSLIKSNVNTSFNGLNNENRYLQGQSPYLVNIGLYHQTKNIQASVLYNVVGPRIYLVGDGVISPTVYEMPRNQVDFTLQRKISKKWDVKAGIQDLLNQSFKFVNDTNNDQKIDLNKDDVFRSFKRGRSFNMGFTFNI